MSSPSHNLSILLVDDDAADNFIHRINLRSSGFVKNIEEFLYARDALNFLESEPDIDIIMVDVNLPRMNGFKFLKAYRALEVMKPAKIILLTSSLSPIEVEQSKQFPEIFAYCPKPLTDNQAVNILQSVAAAKQCIQTARP